MKILVVNCLILKRTFSSLSCCRYFFQPRTMDTNWDGAMSLYYERIITMILHHHKNQEKICFSNTNNKLFKSCH